MSKGGLPLLVFVALVGVLSVGRSGAAVGFQARPAGFETSSPVSSLLAGDFDQDGRTDVFFVDPRLGRAVVVFAEPGHVSGFGRFNGTSVGAEAGQTAIADVDGDTLLDYVVPDRAGHFWIGRYRGTIVSRSQSVAGTPVAVALADWTSGAFTDLALIDARAGTVSLWVNDGGVPPRFVPGQVLRVEAAPVRALTLDWNGDDTTDILVVQVRQSSDVRDVVIQILTGDGAGRFVAGARLVVDADPATIATADFDADGNVDLVMLDRAGDRCSGNSSILISMGRGDGAFGEIVRREIGCPFFSGGARCPAQTLVVVDVDGRGGDDLVVFLRDPRSQVSPRDLDAAEVFLARGANLVDGPVFFTPRGALARWPATSRVMVGSTLWRRSVHRRRFFFTKTPAGPASWPMAMEFRALARKRVCPGFVRKGCAVEASAETMRAVLYRDWRGRARNNTSTGFRVAATPSVLTFPLRWTPASASMTTVATRVVNVGAAISSAVREPASRCRPLEVNVVWTKNAVAGFAETEFAVGRIARSGFVVMLETAATWRSQARSVRWMRSASPATAVTRRVAARAAAMDFVATPWGFASHGKTQVDHVGSTSSALPRYATDSLVSVASNCALGRKIAAVCRHRVSVYRGSLFVPPTAITMAS